MDTVDGNKDTKSTPLPFRLFAKKAQECDSFWNDPSE